MRTAPFNPGSGRYAKAQEHLEAARTCMDESGGGMGSYLIEHAIDEITNQRWPALDPLSEELPTKQKLTPLDQGFACHACRYRAFIFGLEVPVGGVWLLGWLLMQRSGRQPELSSSPFALGEAA